MYTVLKVFIRVTCKFLFVARCLAEHLKKKKKVYIRKMMKIRNKIGILCVGGSILF